MTSPGLLARTRAATAASTSAIDRARDRIHARAAAGVVQMIVGETGNYGLPFQINDRRLRAGELSDVGVRADRRKLAARDRDRLHDRKLRVDRDDVAVDKDYVRRLRRLRGADRNGRGSDRDNRNTREIFISSAFCLLPSKFSVFSFQFSVPSFASYPLPPFG